MSTIPEASSSSLIEGCFLKNDFKPMVCVVSLVYVVTNIAKKQVVYI